METIKLLALITYEVVNRAQARWLFHLYKTRPSILIVK